MNRRIAQRILISLLFTAVLCAGGSAQQERVPKLDPLGDVIAALDALPDALVLDTSPDGLPRHIVGDLARVDVNRMKDPASAEDALRAVLAGVVARFEFLRATCGRAESAGTAVAEPTSVSSWSPTVWM